MPKRLDSPYLKRLSKWYRDDVAKWAAMPLVVLSPSSELCNRSQDHARGILEGDKYSQALLNLLTLDYELPIHEFMLLNTMVKVSVPADDAIGEFNYYSIEIKEVDGDTQLSLIYPTESEGYTAVALRVKESGPSLSCMMYDTSTHNPVNISDSLDDYHIDVRTFLTALLVSTLSFFYLLSKSDKHAVEAKGTNHRKHNAKKPWQRTDLSTIQFLNVLPRESKPHQGGTHQSPRYHQRRPTTRRLTNDRFKNHPQFGKTISVKGSWVGEKSSIVNGVTYKVL